MSDIINQVVQSFEPGDLVILFELDASSLGGAVYHFTSQAYGDAPVVFDGTTYVPIDVEASGFEWSGRGSLPTPKLRIANTTQAVAAAVIELKDLLGAQLTRIRTFRQFLDDGSSPDPTAIFPLDVYRVERKVNHNKIFIEWELSAIIDQQGRKLPGRQFLKDYCTKIYRIWDVDSGSGNIVSGTTTSVTLASAFTFVSGETYRLTVQMPDTTFETRNITNAAGDATVITLDAPLSDTPDNDAVWSIASGSGGSFNYEKATCPYSGTDYFTRLDAATDDPSSDACSKLLTGCRKRFGESGPDANLPSGAFPGIGRFF